MIYLDYAAATPLDPRVFKAIQPYLTEHFANPSSIHRFGQHARKAIDESRDVFVKALGASSPKNIIFTGSGTESCNLAIFGAAFANQDKGKHIVISAIEHPAVMEPAEYLRDNFGFTLTKVKPDKEGIVDPKEVKNALRPDTILVSVMHANNETGVIQPIKKIAKIVKKHGAIFHTDACQTPGFLDISAAHLGVDLMTLSASKIYGPKAVGLLYIKTGIRLIPHILGGGQEFRMRGGTESTENIVGFAKAMELTLKNSKKKAAALLAHRDQLEKELLKHKKISLNGSEKNRLPGIINLHIKGASGETMVQRLDMEGLAVSAGAACSSGKVEASPVLLAMGYSKKRASESIRISLGRPSTSEEVKSALQIFKHVLA